MTASGQFNPMTPRGSRRCQCMACKEYFESPAAFDKHRYGPYVARGCLSIHTMSSKGWKLTPSGHWFPPRKRLKTPLVAGSSGE